MHARPFALKQDSDFNAMGIRRASTFPESIPPSAKTTLPLSQTHLSSLGMDPYGSPNQNGDYFETTPSLTPTSATASSLGSYGLSAGNQPRPSQAYPPASLTSLADTSGLPVDINNMMFPSADPLAYPNQPMSTFEDSHPQAYHFKHSSPQMAQVPPQFSGVEMKPTPASYAPSPLSHMAPGGRRSDNEVQLLGPMPMYLMQGAQHRGPHPQHTVPGAQAHLPGQNPGNMNFDEIFGGEEWAQTFMDPSLGLSGGGGYNGQPQYPPPPGPGMGGWQ